MEVNSAIPFHLLSAICSYKNISRESQVQVCSKVFVLQYSGMVELMEAEEGDLIEDLATLPQNNVMNKINEIARRARLVQVALGVFVRSRNLLHH